MKNATELYKKRAVVLRKENPKFEPIKKTKLRIIETKFLDFVFNL